MLYPEFDLNLLRSLDALLVERNVTRAAARVGVTQPAMSRSLARLRDGFGDPLLIRGRIGMEPTECALALVVPVRQILDRIRETASGGAAFEPATSRRLFTVATTDYCELVLLPHLLAQLAVEAPGIDLAIRRVVGALRASDLERDVDLVLAPSGRAPSSMRTQTLFEERFACIVRSGHPRVPERLTRKRYAELSHLLVAPEERPGGPVDAALRQHGLERRVSVRVPGFLIAPAVVARSDLIATLPRRLAEHYATSLPLRVLTPPVSVDGFSIAQMWRSRDDPDPGHRWFRRSIASVLAERRHS